MNLHLSKHRRNVDKVDQDLSINRNANTLVFHDKGKWTYTGFGVNGP